MIKITMAASRAGKPGEGAMLQGFWAVPPAQVLEARDGSVDLEPESRHASSWTAVIAALIGDLATEFENGTR